METTQIFLYRPSPLPTLSFHLPLSAPLSSIPIPQHEDVYLRTASTGPLSPTATIASLRSAHNPLHPISLRVCARVRGGKGGFGTQLRAAGGRMSAKTGTNYDSCRDLSGRRLGTLKEAQRQSELLESIDELRAKARAEDKAKLEALERQLGISSSTAEPVGMPDDDENESEGSASGSGSSLAVKATTTTTASNAASKRLADIDIAEIAQKRHKFDDSKFLEESREINESVRSAVSAAMLLKRKKKKAATASTPTTGSTATPTAPPTASGKGKGKEKEVAPAATRASEAVVA